MAGIEGFSPKKKKPPKVTRIPHDPEGISDAKEASDDDLNAFITDTVTENISAPQSHHTISMPAGDANWIVISQHLTTDVYVFNDQDSPAAAITQVLRWEAQGTTAQHRAESNTEYLTKQVIGVPSEPGTILEVNGGIKSLGNLLGDDDKKAAFEKDLPEIEEALNDIIDPDAQP